MTTKEGGLRGSIRNVGVGVPAIPDSEVGQIEDFESGNLNDYQNDLSQFEIQSVDPIEGSNNLNGLEGAGSTFPPFSNADASIIWSDQLDNYPGRGFETKYSFAMSVDGVNSGAGTISGLLFAIQDLNNYYFAGTHNDNENYIYKVKNGSVVKSDTASQNHGQSEWYTATIQYGDPTISYDSRGTTVSIDDTEWDGGHVGFVVGDVRNDSVQYAADYDDVRNSTQL